MRRRPVFLIAFVVVVAAVVTTLVIVLRNNQPKTTLGQPTSGATKIQGYGGTIELAAHVYLPAGAGPHPLLVIPGSWGASAERYAQAAKPFTQDGYVVVSYAQRGIGKSGGQLDLGAEPTQRDVSRVITWSINHEPVDPNEVAVLGLSYGGGMSLMAAERDPRIKAVVAMSTWTNLEQAYFPNGTPNRLMVQTLFNASTVVRLAPAVKSFYTAFASGNYAAAQADMSAISPGVSPITNISSLNRHKTPIMIVNDYQDSYFVPSQLTAFFDALTVPKRLVLGPGDHGTLEFPGLDGQPSAIWDNARKWLDHYVRGDSNGIENQAEVQLEDLNTGATHGFTEFPAADPKSLYLGGGDTGALTSTKSAGWTRTITSGVPTVANVSPLELDVIPYRRVERVPVNAISRAAAATWNSGPLPSAVTIVGQPTLHVSVSLFAAQASLFVHLYDVTPSGLGDLITTSTYSIANATPNQPKAYDIPFETTAYTLPAGHHLSVVIDTTDTKFASLGTRGEQIAFTSSAADPSRLVVATG